MDIQQQIDLTPFERIAAERIELAFPTERSFVSRAATATAAAT